MSPTIYKSCINKLNRYAKKQGLEINYGDTFAYHPEHDIIELNKHQQYTQVFIIYYLHELGHAIQSDSYFHKLNHKALNIKRSIILEQEYTAWANGYHIARELNILNYIVNDYLLEWVDAWSDYSKHLNGLSTNQLNALFDGYSIPTGRPPLGVSPQM